MSQSLSGVSDFDENAVWAKSDGQTLLCHIEKCLTVYRELKSALPKLPELTNNKRFFQLLFCAVYLHDWGKAHVEFQKVLKKNKNIWSNNRHELFSVPFAEMLPFNERDRKLVALTILGHHKDFETLLDYLPTEDMIEEYRQNPLAEINPLDFEENLKKCLNVPYLAELRNRLIKYYQRFVSEDVQFNFRKIDFSRQKNPIMTFIPSWLENRLFPDDPEYWEQMLLCGTMKICDHVGSAEISEIPILAPNHFNFLTCSDKNWYAHQQECGAVTGNLFLTAPTGSGKTEAAMLWLWNQFKSGFQGRVFYILPYTASINAMHRRLIEDFEGKDVSPANGRYVGVLHGRLGRYIAEYFEDTEIGQEERADRIKVLKDVNRQMIHPIKVLTPFQILKYFYGVKGFEKGFAELAGAMLIFDEIHAYDSMTFAQIAISLNWLKRYMNIRVMIMTATFPTFMFEELRKAVGDCRQIKADDALLEAFTRHEVRLLPGDVFDHVDAIRRAIDSGRRVIVVCNTVARSQEFFSKFTEELGDSAVLLHSRFAYQHRMEKEKNLFNEKIKLLVGTQAIEVSLDIDFDEIYTEPAPLDALIQRFGRINRKRDKDICKVHVCRKGGENDHFIYPTATIQRTLAELEGIRILKEKRLQKMLDAVYSDWPDPQLYKDTKAGFMESLKRLRPFMRHQEEEKEFYKRFNGVEVLPACFEEEYDDCVNRLDFIGAERLMVSLQSGTFWKLNNNGWLEKSAAVVNRNGRLGNIPYWRALCKYTNELGLMDSVESDSNQTHSSSFF